MCTPPGVQVFWFYLLPSAIVICWDVKARQEFVRALPAGAMSADERAWWSGLSCPPDWQLVLLFTPALSLACWRIMLLAAA